MRGGFRIAIFALAGWFPIFFAHAQTSDKSAECLGMDGARLPTKVTLDDGSILTVVDRSDGKMHQRGLSADGQTSDVVTYRGLFPLTSNLPPSRIEYTWKKDLASFFPFKVGEKISANAIPKIADVALPTPYYVVEHVTEMSVMGIESVRIGECDYPVFKINLLRPGGGRGSGAVTSYYHQASMLTLRAVTTIPATSSIPAKTVDRRAVKLE
jgi:hypothetical protein